MSGFRPWPAAARLALAAACLASRPAAQEAPHLARGLPPAGRVPVAEAVRAGVRFLVESQNKDGSFGHHTVGRTWEIMCDVPGSHQAFKVASTALAWMALDKAAGGDPATRDARHRALAYLVDHARVRRPNGVEIYNVWAFGYGLQAMARALASPDPGVEESRIRATADALVKALEIYQVPDGGWGYYDFDVQTYHPGGSSTPFTTSTILVAAHEAEAQGILVPAALKLKAVRSIRRCRLKDGSYIYGTYLQYVPRMGINQLKGSAMRNPGCDLAVFLNRGDVTPDDMRRTLENFRVNHRFSVAGVRRPMPHESWYQISGYFYLFGHFNAAMVLEHLGPADHARYWPVVIEGVLKCREPDGSFWDYPIYGYGKAYGTGFALLALAGCPAAIADAWSPAPAAAGGG